MIKSVKTLERIDLTEKMCYDYLVVILGKDNNG